MAWSFDAMMSEDFMPVKNKKVHSIQMYEGSWYRVKGYNYTECCDCALVHKEQFRIVDGHLEWSGIRDDKLTEERRKELGIKVVRKKVKSDKRKSK